MSQVDGPVDHVEEEEGEREEGSGIEVDALGGGGDDGFGWRRLLVGFALRLEVPLHLHGFTVAVKVREFKVPRQGSHDAEVVGAKVRLGGADLLTSSLHHLGADTNMSRTEWANEIF